MKTKLTADERDSLKLAYEFMHDEYKKIKRSRGAYICKEDSLEWIKKRMADFQSATKKLNLRFVFVDKFPEKEGS